MIVECPECNEKISDQANPCPHCGLLEAGRYSRKFAELLKSSAEGKFFWRCIDFGCRGHFSSSGPPLQPWKMEVAKRDSGAAGFEVYAYFKCGICHKGFKMAVDPDKTHWNLV